MSGPDDIELKCNFCGEIFPESEVICEEDFELCPHCLSDALVEREMEDDFSDDALIEALDSMDEWRTQ